MFFISILKIKLLNIFPKGIGLFEVIILSWVMYHAGSKVCTSPGKGFFFFFFCLRFSQCAAYLQITGSKSLTLSGKVERGEGERGY